MFSGTVGWLTQQSGVLSARVPSRGQRRTAHAAARPGAKVASKASKFPAEDAIGLSIANVDATPPVPWNGWILPLGDDITNKKKIGKKKLANKLEIDAIKKRLYGEDKLEVLLATLVGRTDKCLTSEQAKVVMQLLQSSDRSDQLRAAHAVYLLGWKKKSQDTLGGAGIIRPLAKMLNARHSGAQKAAAAAISNLVASNSNRKKLIATDSESRLWRLLRLNSAHTDTKVFAARALGGFKRCFPSDNTWLHRCIYITENLEGLLKEAHPVLLQVEAATALCIFSCEGIRQQGEYLENQLVDLIMLPMSDIVQDAAFGAVTPSAIRYITARVFDREYLESLPSLVRLLQCKQTRVQYAAAMAVCVVARRAPAKAEALEQAGAIPGVVELLYSPTPSVHGAALRAVKLLRSHDSLKGKVTAAVRGSLREHEPREDVIRLLQEP